MKKFTSLSLTRYLEELSSNEPVPGGGSASAYVACLGMGLAEMVAQIGMKKVNPQSKPDVRKTIRLLQKARKDALQVVNLDPQVYRSVIKSYAQAKNFSNETKRNRLIDEALEDSFRLQADLALLVSMAKKASESLQGLIRGSIQNDLLLSQAFLDAAFRGAYDTAKINVVYLKDPERKLRCEQALEELRKQYEGRIEAARVAGD